MINRITIGYDTVTTEISFILNNELVSIKSNPAVVLLDFIRKQKHLTGTKEGCKEGDCGACTVLVGSLCDNGIEYRSVNSCLLPIANINNKHVVTIEGINSESFTTIQREFIDEGASQCGFCTPGFIVSLTGYLINNNTFNYNAAENAIAGNICRCTGYTSIKNVLKNIGNRLSQTNNPTYGINDLVRYNFLPEYFTGIPERLKRLAIKESNGKTLNLKKVVSGGTDLFVQVPDELLETESVFMMDKHLSFIKAENNRCIVGAATTFETVNGSKIFQDHFPRLNRFMSLIASLPIRNCATIGGNIVNASPIGDMTIILLALNSEITLFSGQNRRKILLKDFYKGYKNLDLKQDEYVESIEFKLPGKNSYFNFEKVSKRTNLDIASANSAIYIEAENNIIKLSHISAGGVSPVPLYLEKTSKFLSGKEIGPGLVDEAAKILQSEISPISDVRGSAEYKRLLIAQLFKAHFIELFPELIKMEAFA